MFPSRSLLLNSVLVYDVLECVKIPDFVSQRMHFVNVVADVHVVEVIALESSCHRCTMSCAGWVSM